MANLRSNNLTGTGGRNAIDGSVLLQSNPKSRISVTNTTGLDFGTDQFTIEFWIYLLKEAPVNKNIFARSTSNSGTTGMIMWFDGNGHLEFDSAHGASGAVHTGAAIPINTWHHIAVTRDSSNNTRLYLNGVNKASASSDTTDIVGATNLQIASNIAADGYFNDAYISNFRMVKGTAVYSGTTDFTPPTEKLTAIDGTILLCCQDSDDPTQEATGKTITGFGNLDTTQTEKINGRFNQDPTGNGWSLHSGASGSYANGQWTVTSPAQIWKGAFTSFTSVIGQQYRLTGIVVTSNNWGSISVSNDGGAAKIVYPGWNSGSTFPLTINVIFTATSTTTFISIDNLNTTNTTVTTVQYVSVKPVEVGKASKVLPSVGIDEGVVFDGDTKVNTQGYMYFPTGDTSQRGRGRGVFAGGYTGPSGSGQTGTTTMEYFQIQSGGRSIDFGTLSEDRKFSAGLASATRGVVGGSDGTPSWSTGTMEYVTIATTSNTTTFGNMTAAGGMVSACSNNTRGIYFSVWDASGSGPTHKGHIDYITIATAGNAADFGELSVNRPEAAGFSSPTRGICAGGYPTADGTTMSNVIDYITIATTGNASDFGDLTQARQASSSASSQTRGVVAAGFVYGSPASTYTINTIDYVTIASTGDATDFGDLVAGATGKSVGNCSNQIRGVFAGGKTSSPTYINTVEFINIAVTGNASDFGDLTRTPAYGSVFSDSHGGLS